jgi:hypothetical protein
MFLQIQIKKFPNFCISRLIVIVVAIIIINTQLLFCCHSHVIWGNGENYIITSLMICTPYPILCGWLNREEWDGPGMWHVWGRGVHRVLVGKPEGKRPLGRPRHRWEYNIKMDLQEVRGGCGDWMKRAHDSDSWRTLVSMVMDIRFP